MIKRWFIVFVIAVLCFSTIAEAKNRRRGNDIRRKYASDSVPCPNFVSQTEDFTDAYWSSSGGARVVNGGTSGPFPGTWSQLWTADATTGSHTIYTASAITQFEDYGVMSIYAKPYSDYNRFRTSIYNGTVFSHAIADWYWNGSTWTETGSDIEVSEFIIQDVGNGWYRLSLVVDAVSLGWVGDDIRPYIWFVNSGAHENKGNYLWGVNITTAKESICSFKQAGNVNKETLVVQRGEPNDFWFNYTFAQDAGANSSGFEFEPTSNHEALWYLGDDYMDVVRAWGITTSSDAGIIVADNEFAVNHHDLNDNIYKNERDPINGIDDDGNGLVDDYMGWDLFSWDNNVEVNEAEDDFALAASDGQQHGTQMISFMGAVGNNEGFSVPGSSENRAGSVGVLWDVPIFPCSSVGIGAKSGVDRSYSFNGSKTYAVAEIAMSQTSNFRVISQSYLGQADSDVEAAYYHGLLMVTGAGNSNASTGLTYASGRNWVMPIGAVNYLGKTGNIDPSGAGKQDGSSSFGSNIAMSGYAAVEGGYYDTGNSNWYYPPSRAQYPVFTNGWFDVTNVDDAIQWKGNVPPNNIGYGIIPSPAFTSGATAQASALASMILGMYPTLNRSQVRAMMERGCVTDVYDGRNIDQCNDGDCDGLLGAGRMSAYRSITMWGAIGDTTLSGDVYVSGDVVLGAVTVTGDITFHIAPYDLYEQEIDNAALTCQSQYDINYTGYTHSADDITIHITGAMIIPASNTVTFKSYAKYPGVRDWGGIYAEGSGNIYSGDPFGTLVVENTTDGEF